MLRTDYNRMLHSIDRMTLDEVLESIATICGEISDITSSESYRELQKLYTNLHKEVRSNNEYNQAIARS